MPKPTDTPDKLVLLKSLRNVSARHGGFITHKAADAIEAQSAELASLRARLAAAEAEIASKSEQIGKLYKVCNEKAVLQNALAAAEASLAEAREVVGPFANLIDTSSNGYESSPDDTVVRSVGTIGRDYAFITVGDLRRARAWLDAAEQKGGDACDREPGPLHKTTPQPVEPPAGADVEVGEWRKIFRTPSPTEPTEGEVEAAARVFCSGLPPDSNAAASTPAGMLAKGRCWAPECNCWEEGKELTRAALRAAARARAPQGE